jgi:hypothetical protein
MLVRVFTLGLDPLSERFDDEPVRAFLADKDVISIHDHFFVKEGAPYLALVVCYRMAGLPASAAAVAPGQRQRDESWRDALDKADWPLFNSLRDWRGRKASRPV